MRKFLLIITLLSSITIVDAQSTTNTLLGVQAGGAITTGTNNTGLGYQSLFSTTTATNNTATGYQSLYTNVTGLANAAFGVQALYTNNSGGYNTALGMQALLSNTTASYNTAIGHQALALNTTGPNNTAVGRQSMYHNLTGQNNTALGISALAANTSGNYNVAVGASSLLSNSNGGGNVSIGQSALVSNSTGSNNTAVGFSAGTDPTYSNITGSMNTFLGAATIGTATGDATNSTAIGYAAQYTASNMVAIGNSSITKIVGFAPYTNLSDARFKTNIKEDVIGLNFINQLKPVSYTFDFGALNSFLGAKSGSNTVAEKTSTKRQTGFLAQDVEALVKKTGSSFAGVNAPENDKDYYSIAYSEFVVPLVKAVQELSAISNKQQKNIDSLVTVVSILSKGKAGTVGSNSGYLNQAILYQNFPNPFGSSTQINLFVPDAAQNVILNVSSSQGVILKSIKILTKGNSNVTIAGGELAAGVYLYSLIVDGQTIDSKRMVLTN